MSEIVVVTLDNIHKTICEYVEKKKFSNHTIYIKKTGSFALAHADFCAMATHVVSIFMF